MNAALRHRGPDGEGIWINRDATAGLAHRRLAIIDLSENGRQPMSCLEGKYTVIHNGEIYNYIELKEELQKKGYSFRTKTDTEVIAAAYDYWKDESVDHFDGMFAFAIWDDEKKELFAARDRFGEKPFFYHYQNGSLFFASEMKAFWAAGIPRIPNLKMLFNFITIGYTDNPSRPEETFFENIFKLPAASTLSFSLNENELVIEKYWDIDLTNQNNNISDEETIEHFTFLFNDSVRKKLRSDVAIGTSLSGGLDSSSIIATIDGQQSLNYKPKAFTASFPDFDKDEFEFAKYAADTYALEHFTVNMSADQLASDMEKLMYFQEEPFGSAGIYAQYKVYELAGNQGIKALLDGQGADEILAGYPKYYPRYWQELFKKRKLIKSGELRAAKENGITEKFGLKNIMASFFPEFASVFLEQQYLLHALKNKELTSEFVHLQSKEAYYITPAMSGLNSELYFNTCMHGLEELLRYADRNSLAHGVEVRLPFLQHKLVEFIFSLPANFKIRQGWTKWLLRKSLTGKLPDAIVWRKNKIGFEPPQHQWMQNKNLQDLIIHAKKKLESEKILRPGVADKKIQPAAAYDSNNKDWKYLTAGLYL